MRTLWIIAFLFAQVTFAAVNMPKSQLPPKKLSSSSRSTMEVALAELSAMETAAAGKPSSGSKPVVDKELMLSLKDPFPRDAQTSWNWQTGFFLRQITAATSLRNEFNESFSITQQNAVIPELSISSAYKASENLLPEVGLRFNFNNRRTNKSSSNQVTAEVSETTTGLMARAGLRYRLNSRWQATAAIEAGSLTWRQTSVNRIFNSTQQTSLINFAPTAEYLFSSKWAANLAYNRLLTKSETQAVVLSTNSFALGVVRKW